MPCADCSGGYFLRTRANFSSCRVLLSRVFFIFPFRSFPAPANTSPWPFSELPCREPFFVRLACAVYQYYEEFSYVQAVAIAARFEHLPFLGDAESPSKLFLGSCHF